MSNSRTSSYYLGIRNRRSKRVFNKTGERNVRFYNIPKSLWFFKDLFTSLVDERWRYVLFIFMLSFIFTWFVFAVLWYLIAYAHGDLTIDPITKMQLYDGPGPCVIGAKSFIDMFLHSVELQVSIGYGEKYATEHCPEGIFLMVAQIVVGIAIEGAMIGTVYAKMTRPPKLSTAKFSKKAVVCHRDGKLCLIFRVCDPTGMHTIDTKIRAEIFLEGFSIEGEKLREFQYSLKLENNGKVLLIFPSTICHVIDETSPLYDFSAMDLFDKRFEIVVTLTGNSLSTGQISQYNSSYLPKEIMWGHRFVNLTSYDHENMIHVANYDLFDVTEKVNTPLCSARKLNQLNENFSIILENSDEDANDVGGGNFDSDEQDKNRG